jgi:hypothetical protein
MYAGVPRIAPTAVGADSSPVITSSRVRPSDGPPPSIRIDGALGAASNVVEALRTFATPQSST